MTFFESFSFVPPPQYVKHHPVSEQVNHYVKIWQVRLDGANNTHSLNWGGGGGGEARTENI